MVDACNMRICRSLAAVALAAAAGAASAESRIPDPPECAAEAAEFHNVNEWVLRAIIWHESVNNPKTIVHNKNGSVDVGYGGINSVHFDNLSKYNVRPADLTNGCIGSYVSAWLLSKKIQKYGNTWDAIGAYHSETPEHKSAYIWRIHNVLVYWNKISN